MKYLLGLIKNLLTYGGIIFFAVLSLKASFGRNNYYEQRFNECQAANADKPSLEKTRYCRDKYLRKKFHP